MFEFSNLGSFLTLQHQKGISRFMRNMHCSLQALEMTPRPTHVDCAFSSTRAGCHCVPRPAMVARGQAEIVP